MSNDEDGGNPQGHPRLPILSGGNSTAASRQPKDLVTLSGLAQTRDGTLATSQYFKFLNHDLDDYSDQLYTAEEAKKIDAHLKKLSTGTTAMTPMWCGGDLCPFKQGCVFWQMGKAPVGLKCLVEVQLIKQKMIDYMTEYDVDPTNATEVAYVNELVELEIYDNRLSMNLAKADNVELVMDQMLGLDRDGDVMSQRSISPFLDAKERIGNRKSKIHKMMVADRESQYKKQAALKEKDTGDASVKQADMKRKLDELTRKLDDVGDEVLTPEQLINGEA